MIIDSHVHFPAGWDGRSGAGRQLVRSAMPYGIGACVVSHLFGRNMANLHFPDSASVRAANRFAAEQSALNPGRLFFMGYINPQNPDWMTEFDSCLRQGACGIKLWVSLKDPSGSLENTVKVLRRAASAGKAVYLHVFNRTGGNLPGEIDMAEFIELAQTVPECRMIAGHTGGNWRRSAEIVKHCPENVWMETGGSNPDFGMVDGILKFCPPERLLYGSDGLGRAFFPQIWKIRESSLSSADQDRVLHRNALELLNLPEPPEPDVPPAVPQPAPGPEKIDYCCFCGHYPYEKRPDHSPEQLEKLLEEEGIEAAYTADFGAIFGGASNRDFLERCRGLHRVKPLAAVDPADPEYDALLEETAADPAWQGIWLSPAFHRWKLDDPAYTTFLRRCAEVGKPVFINCEFYEPRFYHPDLHIRPVADGELRSFLARSPFELCIIQGKIPLAGAGDPRHCLWCYTRLSDGSAMSSVMAGADVPKLVRGSEFPFRHLHETLAATQFRMP